MDSIDLANQHAEMFREIALENARADRFRDTEKPLIIDGERHCIDCEDPIPEGRLKIFPYAVRCVECQTRREKE